MKIDKSVIFKGATIVAIALFAFFMFKGGNSTPTGNFVKSVDGLTEVTTTIQGFKYSPDIITVNKGDKVKLTIVNKDNVPHGLHLPQFGLVDGTPAGATKTFEFVAIEGSTNGQATPTCNKEHGETLTFNVV